MHYFGVKLYAVYFLFYISERRKRTRFGRCKYFESLRKSGNAVGMAHPANARIRNPFGNRAVFYKRKFPLSVFACFGMFHLTAEQIRDQLRAVTNPEYGNSERKNLGGNVRRILAVYAVRSARKNDADGRVFLNFFNRHIAGL